MDNIILFLLLDIIYNIIINQLLALLKQTTHTHTQTQKHTQTHLHAPKVKSNTIIIIITCNIYIAPYSARSCSKAPYNIIYNIIIPDSNLFPPSTYLKSQGGIQPMLQLKVQSVTRTHSHSVLSGSHFYGRVNQSPHDNIAAHRALKPRPFGYESYTLTNCTITANLEALKICYMDLLCFSGRIPRLSLIQHSLYMQYLWIHFMRTDITRCYMCYMKNNNIYEGPE